ncbi:MAG: nitrogenase component I subunit alpha, partial [Bacillota bacterium]|nr:nitrogenase component I subunit alpha [Bacillota bacterium]
MPFIRLKCDELIPEREKHTYVTEKEKSIIPLCNISTVPGDMTERGCAFAGARGVVGGPITDAIQIVHSPIGCAYYTWATRRHMSDQYAWSLPGRLDNVAFNRRYCVVTDMEEKDVVFGGSRKLLKSALESIRLFPEAPGVIMYTTCTSGLIGDDIGSVAKQIEKETGKLVFFAEAPGCSGVSQSKGHHVANRQFFGQINEIRRKQPELILPEEERTPYDIVLVGEYNMDWDLKVILPLMERIGVRVLTTFTGNARMMELVRLPDTKLNVVHCQRSATYIADMVKEGYDIPYVKASFFGIQQTNKALRTITHHFGLDELAEQVIAEETARIQSALDWYRERLSGKTVAIYVGGPRVWHWIKLLEELGMKVVAGACTFAHEDDYEKINSRAPDGMLVIDNPNEFEIEELLETCKPDIFLCGLKEKFLGRKMGIPTLNSHSYEKGPYAGYVGFINFAR